MGQCVNNGCACTIVKSSGAPNMATINSAASVVVSTRAMDARITIVPVVVSVAIIKGTIMHVKDMKIDVL